MKVEPSVKKKEKRKKEKKKKKKKRKKKKTRVHKREVRDMQLRKDGKGRNSSTYLGAQYTKLFTFGGFHDGSILQKKKKKI